MARSARAIMAMIPQAYERRRAAAVADRAPHNMQPEPVTCGHGTRAGDHARASRAVKSRDNHTN